jgi:hypothetical protein
MKKPNNRKGWVGVDLDGTLAHYTGWVGPTDIGEPVAAMLARVRQWIADGVYVKIFTARADRPDAVKAIQAWCITHGLGDLEVTATKDFGMLELWDDRAVQVVPNQGIALQDLLEPRLTANEKLYLNLR